MVGPPEPYTVDGDGLHQIDPAAYSSGGGVRWWTSTLVGSPNAQAFHNRVHADGQPLLLIGDVAAYSLAATPGGPPTFDQLFSGGNWAT